MFCGKCGKQIDDNAVVCQWCGAPTGVEMPIKEKEAEAVQKEEYKQANHYHQQSAEKKIPMARLGISVGILALFIYFSGLISSTILVLAAGYVLIKEEDRWLRAVAAKAILIICIFGVITAGIGMLENGISGLNYLIMSVGAGPLDRFAVQDLCSFLKYVTLIIRDLTLLIAGIQALHCNNFKIGFIDRMINRNIQK